MKYSVDYFKAMFNYSKDIYELPEAVKVHVLSAASGREYDFYIKFVWEYGVGFPESEGGCSWCSAYVDTVMTMPDGTALTVGDPDEFIEEVFNWFKRRDRRKVNLTADEVEFMDI